MKKILLLMMAIMPLIGLAQPTINNMLVMPIGSTYTMQMDSSLGVNSGGSGSNQTWNYASIIHTIPDSTALTVALDPLTAPYATDSFPGSNVVLNTGVRYDYYSLSGNTAYRIGFYFSNTNHFFYYQNSEQINQNPITYLNTFTDSYQRHYTAAGYNADGTGTNTVTADAYGTITTPAGTYANCLRILEHQVNVDTIFTLNLYTPGDSYSYWWFDGVHFAPVFVIDSAYTGANYTYAVHHLINETVGVNEVQQNKIIVMVFPNPNKGQVTFCYHLNTPNGKLQIKDISGRLVYEETISGVFGNAIINTAEFDNGIYFYQISNDKETKQGKFVVEK
jgi:hypothetical protein